MSVTKLFPVLLAMLIASCASVDYDAPKQASYALDDTSDTRIGRQVENYFSTKSDDLPAFALVTQGIDALALRLLLAARAERSIDAQYYLITDDEIGGAFLTALLQAADRGVRVRFLIDDVLTGGYDRGMAALASHPNIEIRAFNPFARGARYTQWITNFGQVNRRMHNKSFIVDNQVAIIGGRNIAAEYFDAREDVNFGDLDVFTVGSVVPEVSTMFDQYWNHQLAVPAENLVEEPDNVDLALTEMRIRFTEVSDQLRTSKYADVVMEQVLAIMESDVDSALLQAPYNFIYDSPDKADRQLRHEATSMIPDLADTLVNAQQDILVITPYLVPSGLALEEIGKLLNKGVRVRILTNSLSATNHKVVHSGYMGARKLLLEMGAEIYEVRPDMVIESASRAGKVSAAGTLHVKAFIIDEEKFYIGSFNWDPRSVNINTEMGVIIESGELTRPYIDAIEKELPLASWKLQLSEEGKINWIDESGDEPIIYSKDPLTGWGTRAFVKFMSWMPIKGLL